MNPFPPFGSSKGHFYVKLTNKNMDPIIHLVMHASKHVSIYVPCYVCGISFI